MFAKVKVIDILSMEIEADIFAKEKESISCPWKWRPIYLQR